MTEICDHRWMIRKSFEPLREEWEPVPHATVKYSLEESGEAYAQVNVS